METGTRGPDLDDHILRYQDNPAIKRYFCSVKLVASMSMTFVEL